MITQLTDDILAEYTDDDIAAYIEEESSRTYAPEAVALYISVLRMDAELREDVFRLFKRAPLLCGECGRPSCIHGYPDD